MNKKDREQFFNELLYYQHEDVIFYLEDEDYPLGMRYSEDHNVVMFCRQMEKDVWNLRAEMLSNSDEFIKFQINVSEMPSYNWPAGTLLLDERVKDLCDIYEVPEW